MNADLGYVYVLTNAASFKDPGWIKIGYTNQWKSRMRTLNTSVPFDFELFERLVTRKYKVIEKQAHKMLKLLAPELKVGEKHEFYKMPLSKAHEILTVLAAGDPESKIESGPLDKSGAAPAKKDPAKAFRFSMIGAKPGDVIAWKKDPAVTATVLDDFRVTYAGKDYSLTALAQKLIGSSAPIQGPAYFTFNGKLLTKLRKDR